jgi:hypothetical protein
MRRRHNRLCDPTRYTQVRTSLLWSFPSRVLGVWWQQYHQSVVWEQSLGPFASCYRTGLLCRIWKSRRECHRLKNTISIVTATDPLSLLCRQLVCSFCSQCFDSGIKLIYSPFHCLCTAGSYIYPANQAPGYKTGHAIAMSCLCLAFTTATFQWWWFNRKNQELDQAAQEAKTRGEEAPSTFRFMV